MTLAPPPPRRLVALVDCSAFYCSCERVFDPAIRHLPIAVLSNNDGCVIARSAEVKAAGIPMGTPFFKAKGRLAAIGARVYSSNYALYGDMSRRVMACLESFTPEVEPYSIDEAFLSVSVPKGTFREAREQVEALARQIRARVLRWTGIPVRVSFAATRTLAKAASELARAEFRAGRAPCVCLYGHPGADAWLAQMPTASVWGVGRRWAKKLAQHGAHSAADLAALPDALIRHRFSVMLLRTAMELRGVPCAETADQAIRKTLVKSRSVGEPVTALGPLLEAVATHAARAAEKLRREGLVAGHLQAFCTTKGFGNGPHRSFAHAEDFPEHTSDSRALIAAARRCIAGGYAETDFLGRPFRYRKAGVMLCDVRPAGQEQRALALLMPEKESGPEKKDEEERARQAELMAAVDRLNGRFGERAVTFGSMGTPDVLRRTREVEGAPRWERRQQQMSPRYTTRLDELPLAHAR